MAKAIVRLGDKLSSGGSVISASSTMILEGKKAVLVGDAVSCPIKGHGVNKIVEGDPSWISDGKPVVTHQCKCQCGCYVIASLQPVNIG
ncbi:PAAR domain-containing protein [Pectobacterium sp. B1J-3]|uniref:PAAR domain-containing protein n=1 Tax=Pectobacterium sp. B1J-3 TaxID=3385371 RepID=UPI003906858F